MPPITQLYTQTTPFALARSSNSTNGSFSAVTPQSSQPSGEGVVRRTPNHLFVLPFGTDGDDETFDMRLIGWRPLDTQNSWYPFHLGTITATLSSALTGVASETPNGTSDFFADSLSASSGSGNFDIKAGVTDVLPAAALIDANGAQIVEFQFSVSSAASANALYAVM